MNDPWLRYVIAWRARFGHFPPQMGQIRGMEVEVQ